MVTIKHFDLDEFDQPGKPGSGGNMRISTLLALDATRESYGKAMRISSGFRGPDHNKKVGGARNSAHLAGYAADVAGIEDADIVEFLESAWNEGKFRRFGIMNGAVHVDNDPTKPGPALWGYGNETSARFKAAQKWFQSKLK